MTPEPMVAAVVVRRVVAKLVAQGIERDALLAEAGLAPSALGLTRLRLPWVVVEDLFEAGERLTGDDRIGLHVATRYDTDALEVPELLFFASRTLGDAMRRFERIQRLWSDAERGTLLLDPPRIRYALPRPPRPALRHLHEHAATLFVHFMRVTTGVRIEPVEVRLTHARVGDVSEYERFCGCPVRFGTGITELTMRPEQLELPIPTANPLFARHFEARAQAELDALVAGRQGLRERVREVLNADLAALGLGESRLESAAARLRTSPRTLQRGLGAEGTSFAKELEAVRREAAEEMLRAGMDIAEASWRLGYAEPPVFHRAFKRWTGETPERFRQRTVGP